MRPCKKLTAKLNIGRGSIEMKKCGRKKFKLDRRKEDKEREKDIDIKKERVTKCHLMIETEVGFEGPGLGFHEIPGIV